MFRIEFLNSDDTTVHAQTLYAPELKDAQARAMYLWHEFREETGAVKLVVYETGSTKRVWVYPNN